MLRGKWLLENLLGAPPPPPPPNVPASTENGQGGETPTSVRERMEQHRRNPVCASCHAQMDPLGLALENFDASASGGRATAGRAIDATGRCPTAAVRRPGRHSRRRWSKQPDALRRDADGEAADLCARPRRRVLRYAGDPPDHARRGAQRLPLVVAHRWHRPKHAVSDEAGGSVARRIVMIITKKYLLPRARSCAVSARRWRCRCSTG